MQSDKSNMSKRQFRIGDLAEELKVKKFVIRFWEKEFDIHSDRSQGGQRFYTTDDLKKFMTIKDLLYNQKFTIAGAKKQLDDLKNSGGGVVTTMDTVTQTTESDGTAHVQEEAAAQATAPEEDLELEQLTPATKAPTLDDTVAQQLREFKERLLAFKNRVDRL